MAHAKPTVNLNGTSREALIRGYIDAMEALRTAARALAEISPHGRDYPDTSDVVQPGHETEYRRAVKEHIVRKQRIIDTINELEWIAENI